MMDGMIPAACVAAAALALTGGVKYLCRRQLRRMGGKRGTHPDA